MNFSDIIHPVSIAEFKEGFYGKALLRVPGPTHRFAHLVPWSALNDVVTRLRADAGRISLVRNGRKVDPEEYLVHPSSGRGPRLNVLALERRLRFGDSLVVNGVQDLFREIEDVADSIESICRVQVGANLYAGFKHWRGFELHFDTHDTLIVQIHGQKSWQVYEPTIPYPLSRERPQDMVTPTKAPLWEGLLKSGDALYMPRGWWHVAEPVDSPSVHVTFSIPQPTGLDLIAWLLEDLKEVSAARRPMPIFGPTSERESFAKDLAEIVARHLGDDVVTRYFRTREPRTSHQPTLSLPSAAVGDVPALESTTPLVLVGPRRLALVRLSDREIGFRAANRVWRCDVALKPALESLEDQHGHSIDDLDALVPAALKSLFRLFVRTLLEAGVLVPTRTFVSDGRLEDRNEAIPSQQDNAQAFSG